MSPNAKELYGQTESDGQDRVVANLGMVKRIGLHLPPKARRHKITPAQAHFLPRIACGHKCRLVDHGLHSGAYIDAVALAITGITMLIGGS